jgi:hypothetical protein
LGTCPLSIDVPYGVSRPVDPPRAIERPGFPTVPKPKSVAQLLVCCAEPVHGGTIAGKTCTWDPMLNPRSIRGGHRWPQLWVRQRSGICSRRCSVPSSAGRKAQERTEVTRALWWRAMGSVQPASHPGAADAPRRCRSLPPSMSRTEAINSADPAARPPKGACSASATTATQRSSTAASA